MKSFNVIQYLQNIENKLDKVYNEAKAVCMINNLLEANKHIAQWNDVDIDALILKWWYYEVMKWLSIKDIPFNNKQYIVDSTFSDILHTMVDNINNDIRTGNFRYFHDFTTFINEYTDADINMPMSTRMLSIHLCLLIMYAHNLQENPDEIIKDASAYIRAECVYSDLETISFKVQKINNLDIEYNKY